jgi:tetratricopeptide (TPR) repeat protein
MADQQGLNPLQQQAQDQAQIQGRAQRLYQTGQMALERGQYRQAIALLDEALALISRQSILGGEATMLLITSLEAVGDRAQALTLCRALKSHNDLEIRRNSQQLLYILEAPQLQRPADWIVPIPDLSNLDDRASGFSGAGSRSTTTPKPPPPAIPDPIDPTKVNTRENGFIALALWMVAAIGIGVWLL